MLFIQDAFAQAAPQAVGGSTLTSMVPFILILVTFYVLIVRPQQKKLKAHQEMIKMLQKGDKVLMSGGIFGTIRKADPEKDRCEVEIAQGVEISVKLSTIGEVVEKRQAS